MTVLNEKIFNLLWKLNDINCWSGIPFHILNAVKELSFELEGIELYPEKLSYLRLFWNLKSYLFDRGYTGFQFSDLFLNKLTKKIKKIK